MEAVGGRLHYGYGKAADMSKTLANTYKTHPRLDILPILRYSLYVARGAIRSAESAALLNTSSTMHNYSTLPATMHYLQADASAAEL